MSPVYNRYQACYCKTVLSWCGKIVLPNLGLEEQRNVFIPQKKNFVKNTIVTTVFAIAIANICVLE